MLEMRIQLLDYISILLPLHCQSAYPVFAGTLETSIDVTLLVAFTLEVSFIPMQLHGLVQFVFWYIFS
jgi:hypothetical protein